MPNWLDNKSEKRYKENVETGFNKSQRIRHEIITSILQIISSFLLISLFLGFNGLLNGLWVIFSIGLYLIAKTYNYVLLEERKEIESEIISTEEDQIV